MMIFICPVLFVGWKLVHKTKLRKATEADLKQDLAGIEEYTRNYVPIPPK
jgi:amino acid transporter